MNEWIIHQDRDPENPELDSYSITLNKKAGGWNTDSGYEGYGLPKELAQWICGVLNESNKECPYHIDNCGFWEKKKRKKYKE